MELGVRNLGAIPAECAGTLPDIATFHHHQKNLVHKFPPVLENLYIEVSIHCSFGRNSWQRSPRKKAAWLYFLNGFSTSNHAVHLFLSLPCSVVLARFRTHSTTHHQWWFFHRSLKFERSFSNSHPIRSFSDIGQVSTTLGQFSALQMFW